MALKWSHQIESDWGWLFGLLWVLPLWLLLTVSVLFDKKFGDPAVRARTLRDSRSNGEGTRRRLLPDADNPAAVPRHHKEAASHVCSRGLQQSGQGIWRHRDAVLSSWSTKSRAALIGITDGPAKPNFP